MPSRYYVLPYDPASWLEGTEDTVDRYSDLVIMFYDLSQKAKLVFPMFKVFPPFGWGIFYNGEVGVSGCFYDADSGNQILTLEIGEGIEDFIYWYRSYVPEK